MTCSWELSRRDQFLGTGTVPCPRISSSDRDSGPGFDTSGPFFGRNSIAIVMSFCQSHPQFKHATRCLAQCRSLGIHDDGRHVFECRRTSSNRFRKLNRSFGTPGVPCDPFDRGDGRPWTVPRPQFDISTRHPPYPIDCLGFIPIQGCLNQMNHIASRRRELMIPFG